MQQSSIAALWSLSAVEVVFAITESSTVTLLGGVVKFRSDWNVFKLVIGMANELKGISLEGA